MIRMPESSASLGPANLTGRPSRRISPPYSSIAPARIFIKVLLPAPFSPQTAWTSPALALSVTPPSACTPPKFLVMSLISRRGVDRSLMAHGSGKGKARLGQVMLSDRVRDEEGAGDRPGPPSSRPLTAPGGG